MSQEGFNKQQLIVYRLERAKETPQDAHLLFDQWGSPGSVINRSYYAMFYGVLALLTTKGRDRDVTEALENPVEIRRSRSDLTVYLFYKQAGSDRWICAVAKRLNSEGFLITTYITDAIKEGDRIWPR